MKFWSDGGGRFLLRVDEGEEVIETLRSFAAEAGAAGYGIVSGLGALGAATYGHFDPVKGAFSEAPIEGFLEVVTFSGNILKADGVFAPHLHTIVRTEADALVGGHILSATVRAPLEIVLIAYDADKPVRRFSERYKAPMIDD
ncbi:MAG: DUF296 domain-containing protein [Pseudomonadota bacterium]